MMLQKRNVESDDKKGKIEKRKKKQIKKPRKNSGEKMK